MKEIRLGVNIDHVATLRNARGGIHPDPIRAAKIAEVAGADGITVHLREDRRHIRDEDVKNIIKKTILPVNLELAGNQQMIEIACALEPNAVCIVPENRQEVTTEGGLSVSGHEIRLAPFIEKLKRKKIKVSLFIDPKVQEIEAAANIGVDIVEFHTGRYCDAEEHNKEKELNFLVQAAYVANNYGIEVHAGHGLNFDNVVQISKIKQIKELNIGHFIIGEAIFLGLETTIQEIRRIISHARKTALLREIT